MPARPARRDERKAHGRGRAQGPPEPQALLDCRRAVQRLQKLCEAQVQMATAARLLNDDKTKAVAASLQDKIAALSTDSRALLQAIDGCFGSTTIPLPADSTSEDSAEESSGEEPAGTK